VVSFPSDQAVPVISFSFGSCGSATGATSILPISAH